MYKRNFISVIIPVYNEEKYITSCLLSLADQTLKPDEIIVVDDGSTDDSILKIKNQILKKHIKNLTISKQKHSGPAKARNLGARQAEGEILVFVDADMTFDKNYIKEISGPIIQGYESAVFTKSEWVGNLDNIWARFWNYTNFGSYKKTLRIKGNERQNTFRAIKRSSFLQSGGYESGGYFDDSTVLEKIGIKAYGVNAICYHKNPSTIGEVFISARWIGRDSKNRNKYYLLLAFFPPWSLFKAVFGTIKLKSFRYLIFKLVYDFGCFLGLIDTNLMGISYK